MTEGLLTGLRVLDLSRILAGPFAAQALAELGADVVKVESPEGDPARRIGPFVDGTSLYFASLNTGKRSVVLDVHTSHGRDALGALLARAEVVIQNFRPATATRLGLDPTTLLTAHPHLVIVSVPGYASGSTRGDEPSYDLVVQAETGIMAVTGEPGRPPVRAGVPIGDLAAGLWAALGAVSGYVSRMRTGRGSHVEVPLFDAALSMLSYVATSAAGIGVEPRPVGSGHHTVVPYGAFPTRDGWLAIAVIGEKFWDALVDALGLDDLRTFDDNESRRERRREVEAAVAGALSVMRREDAMRLLADAGLPHAPVLGVLEALAGPYVGETERVADMTTGGVGYRYVKGPLAGRAPLRPAPGLGEHTDEILAELDPPG